MDRWDGSFASSRYAPTRTRNVSRLCPKAVGDKSATVGDYSRDPLSVDLDGMSETTTVGDEWLHLPDAVGATGLSERSLQRLAKKGEIEREDRGYGKVFYRIPPALRRDQREETAVVAVLREQGSKQTETIEAAATALERTTTALAKRIETLEAREAEATRRADRRGLAAAFLLAATVAMSATAWRLSSSVETEKATSRQEADSRLSAEKALETERAVSGSLRANLEAAEKATTATAAERDALAEALVSLGMVSGDSCEDGDKSATLSGSFGGK